MARKTAKEASDPLLWIQRLVRCSEYYLCGSDHALKGVADGEFSLGDIKNSIMYGHIRKIQRDEKGEAVDGKKYTICGPGVDGLAFETVGKLIKEDDGEEYLIITAYGRM